MFIHVSYQLVFNKPNLPKFQFEIIAVDTVPFHLLYAVVVVAPTHFSTAPTSGFIEMLAAFL